ncbi:LysR substrate-binding domain-containing protein [Nocardia sp. NPDC052566]|uniref:LysR substrate-binding domain-containing protein n=1 Tax=Nocardia sp. NPDC052566 TaxID=3364330 RepID=UPI0037CCC25A
MEIRLLTYVVAIADEGSVSAAARRLSLTQPTLSRQLHELEKRLGAELFEREGRGLAPTPAGLALVERARRVIAEADAAWEDVRLAAQGRSGTLTVTFAGSGINGPLGAALARLRREAPRVHLRLVESFNDEEMSQGVLDGAFDIAIQRFPLADRRLAAREWLREPLTLFVPQRHRLARAVGNPPAPVPASALGEIPLVLWPREVSPPSYDEIIAVCHRAGVVPKIAAEGRSVQTVLALVAADFGAGVFADSMRVLRRVGVVARPIAGTVTRQHVVCRADDESPLVARFLEVAESVRPKAR